MTDEQTAAAIVADAAANDELQRGNDPTTLRAAIVAALAEVRMKATGQATQRTIDAAFREGYEAALDRNANGAVLKMCHEARMMNGIVDYSDPNATGVVRRVLGTLPVTIDGMVIGTDARVYWTNGAGCIHDIITQDMLACVNGLRLFPSYLHGSREAAEAAKEAKK